MVPLLILYNNPKTTGNFLKITLKKIILIFKKFVLKLK